MLKKSFKLSSLEIKSFLNDKNILTKTFRNSFLDSKFILAKSLFTEEESLKFAVILSSKVFKKAVTRNKIRRRMFSLIENYLKERKNLTNRKILGILIYPKKEIQELKFSDLQEKVYNIFKQFIN